MFSVNCTILIRDNNCFGKKKKKRNNTTVNQLLNTRYDTTTRCNLSSVEYSAHRKGINSAYSRSIVHHGGVRLAYGTSYNGRQWRPAVVVVAVCSSCRVPHGARPDDSEHSRVSSSVFWCNRVGERCTLYAVL